MNSVTDNMNECADAMMLKCCVSEHYKLWRLGESCINYLIDFINLLSVDV